MPVRVQTSRVEGQRGFTLIELLVVITIIGVLAAIAVPSFLRQGRNAWTSAVRADLVSFGLAAEASAVETGGSFAPVFTANAAGDPLSAAGVLQSSNVAVGFEFNGSSSVDLTLGAPATLSTFCVVGHSTNLGAAEGWMTYSKARGGLVPVVLASELLARGQC